MAGQSKSTRDVAAEQAKQGERNPAPVTVTSPAAFDWEGLLPPMNAPASTYTAGGRFTIDQIPAPIRERVEVSLAHTMAALRDADSKGTKRQNVPPQWKLQPVTGPEMAKDFVKLARKYGQNRPEKDIPHYVAGSPVGQITVRLGVIRYVPANGTVPEGARPAPKDANGQELPAGWYVRYAAKPLEKGAGK